MIADDLGLSADDIANTRKAMKAWIDREMQPGDMLSVVTTSGGIGAMEQLTNDRARLYDIARCGAAPCGGWANHRPYRDRLTFSSLSAPVSAKDRR